MHKIKSKKVSIKNAISLALLTLLIGIMGCKILPATRKLNCKYTTSNNRKHEGKEEGKTYIINTYSGKLYKYIEKENMLVEQNGVLERDGYRIRTRTTLKDNEWRMKINYSDLSTYLQAEYPPQIMEVIINLKTLKMKEKDQESIKTGKCIWEKAPSTKIGTKKETK